MEKLKHLLYALCLVTILSACADKEESPGPDAIPSAVSGPYGFKLEMIAKTGDKVTLNGDYAEYLGISRRLNGCISRIMQLYDSEKQTSIRIFFTLPTGFSIDDETYDVDFLLLEETQYLDYPVVEFKVDGKLEADWSTTGNVAAVVSNKDYALLGNIQNVEVVDENNVSWTINGNFWLQELKGRAGQ